MTAESTPFGHKGVVYLSCVRHIHETNLEANFFLHNGSETHVLAFQYYFCVTVFSNFGISKYLVEWYSVSFVFISFVRLMYSL